jgi:outer membrane protein assembly factor BamA
MKRATFLLLFMFVLLVAPAATAQKHSPPGKVSSAAPNKLVALKVTGTSRYTDKDILAASGLQIGQNASEADFKEAVQRLGESGLFSALTYTYSSSATGVRLELQLTDTEPDKLVPVQFDNFVWFTDEELRSALQPRVPLFKKMLPLTGNLPDHLLETLQAIFAEKHLPGRVDFLREGDQNGGPLTAIIYRIEEVNIRIRGVEFPGASSEQASLLAAAARRLTGEEYRRITLATVARLDLMPVYLQRGYLKAEFGPSDARIVPSPSTAGDTQAREEIEVDAIVPVKPGKMYATSSVDWKGNSAISRDALEPLLHLTPGQPVDAVRLLRDVEKVAKVYRSRGYMTVQVRPEAQFDEEKSAVHYDIKVVEGEVYKLGEVEILGLDTEAKARMQAAWTLAEGQPYNADYPQKFLDDTRQLLPRGVHWAVSIHESPDSRDKTVDVEIRFKQQ